MTPTTRNSLPPLRTIDIYCIVQATVYSLIALVYSSKIADSAWLISQNILLICGLVLVNLLSYRFNSRLFWGLRVCLLVPTIVFLFLQVFNYISVVHPRDFDAELIAIDYAVFGVHPTWWIDAFATPLMTEILQIAYVLYFIHPFAQGVELFATRRYAELTVLMRYITFAFLLSYLLYFFIPAVGPRFTLHNYNTTNTDLPGLWLTNALRLFIDSGDHVSFGALNPAATVARNCMPSGHTLISVLNLILAFRFRAKMRYVLAVLTSLLVFSTIYLRYHYVIDVAAGLLLVWVIIVAEPIVQRFLTRRNISADELPSYLTAGNR